MPSRIEELIAEWQKFADTDYTKGMKLGDSRKQAQYELMMAGQSLAYATAAQNLERAYREEVVPLVDALQKLRGYVAHQRRDSESAIAEDAASAKYQKVRGTKRERQINFTKGASCAYEDILRHFPDLRRFDAPAGTPAAKDESNGNLPRD